MSTPPRLGSAADQVALHAERTPDLPAVSVLDNGSRTSVTFASLQSMVRQRVPFLARECPPGSRILLEATTSLDFVACLLAAQHVGCIPVPVPTSAASLARIVEDCEPVLCVGWHDGAFADGVRRADHAAVIEGSAGGVAVPRGPRRTDVAFIQYTSGSTGRPRGAVISHDNVSANVAEIAHTFEHDADSTHVSWLPLYHDMGLVGMLLQPLMVGAHCVHLPHTQFLRDPFSWLSALSEFGGVTSAAPDFGYRYVVRRLARDERLAGLRLQGWRNAINGAEQPRISTMVDFSALLGPAGFDQRSFRPSYGLAESTLLVSAGRFDRRAEPAVSSDPAHATVRRVPCGLPVSSTTVTIADDDGAQLPPGAIGRVLISGPSVAGRYWPDPPAAGQVFDTRDLGWLSSGQLHIAGRVDDTIVVRGVNLSPDDIESAVAARLGSAAGVIAAVPAESTDSTGLGIVVETAVTGDDARSQIERDIAIACVDAVAVAPHVVRLVEPGTVPRTTSGKVRRGAARSLLGSAHENP